MRKSERGVTMLETMLSLAMMVILFGIVAPVMLPLLRKNDLDIASTHTVEALRRSQTLAQSGFGDSAWGVKVQAGSVTVFKGSSYTGRVSGYDEVTSFSPSVGLSGLNELFFSRLYGKPNTTGVITFISTDNVQESITINSEGSLSY